MVNPSTLVLASHQRLDELLTTGHNVPLLQRLGVVGRMEPIVGYKGDPDRKIGLVARLPASDDETPLDQWIQRIHTEFQGLESVVPATSDDRSTYPHPRYIACMNAFEPEVINRALDAVRALTTPTDGPVNPSQVIYLTGQPRPLGTQHADQVRMPCVFTGHRRAEAWAIGYLAGMVEEAFRGLEVVVVDEEAEEEEIQRRKRDARARKGVEPRVG